GARLLCPEPRTKLLKDSKGRHQRLYCRPSLLHAPLQDAESKKRAATVERQTELLVLSQRLLERGEGAVMVALGGAYEPAAARLCGSCAGTLDRRTPLLQLVEQLGGGGGVTRRGKRLDRGLEEVAVARHSPEAGDEAARRRLQVLDGGPRV